MHGFWDTLDSLIAAKQIVIDRPKGSPHPRYPDFIYPYDYGYLEGTHSADGGGVDLWRGSLAASRSSGLMIALDLVKNDLEIKLLLGCTDEEVRAIFAIHQNSDQTATLLLRDE